MNTDNRLMSGTSMSREMELLVDAFGYGWADLQWFTVNAMKSAFIPFDERLDLINARHQAGLRRVAGLRRQPRSRQVSSSATRVSHCSRSIFDPSRKSASTSRSQKSASSWSSCAVRVVGSVKS